MQSDIRKISGIMYYHFNIYLHQTVLVMNCRRLWVHKCSHLCCSHNTLLYSTLCNGEKNYLEHQLRREPNISVHTFPNLSTESRNFAEMESDPVYGRTQYYTTATHLQLTLSLMWTVTVWYTVWLSVFVCVTIQQAVTNFLFQIID